MNPTEINAVTWYPDEATYLQFKQACADPEQFPPTYADWLRCADQDMKQAQQLGGPIPTKVSYGIEEFLAWCHVKSHRADRHARMKFASTKLIELHKMRN